MSDSWQIEGADLDTVDVKVLVEPNSMGSQQGIRKQTIPVLHGLPEQHNLGQDLPKWSLKFRCVGPAPDRYEVLHAIKQALLGNDPFTLTAPDAPNQVYFNNGSKNLDLSLDSHGTVYGDALEEVSLTVTATEV